MATPGALETIDRYNIASVELMARHITGDWGDLEREDKKANNDALKHGGRIVSAYGKGDAKLYVITDAERTVTTILRPDEY